MKAAFLFAALLVVGAWNSREGEPDRRVRVESAPADNTLKNERDRSPAALTPMDQGESVADRGITQRIRKDLVKDSTFSITAKNIKIITVDGVVTLRGPVKSDKERADIDALVRRIDNVKQVDNQLEVAAN